MRAGLAALAALAAAVAGAGGAAACGLALAIGLDVSGSVSGEDYRLQVDGTATALMAPEVQTLILTEAERGTPVALLVFEWSEAGAQALISDWRLIGGTGDLQAVAAGLLDHRRSIAPDATGIGSAMLFAAEQFPRAPSCSRRTLDLSGDGRNNTLPAPQSVRDTPALSGITVNALVIGAAEPGDTSSRLSDLAGLAAYFEANVIRGPGAFVERAEGFGAFEQAMIRKLIREIPAMAIGDSAPSVPPRLAAIDAAR